jgi:hypothetical protein
LYDNYKSIGIQVHLTFCKRIVMRAFNKVRPVEKQFDKDFIYPTNVIAVCHIKKKFLPKSITFSIENDNDNGPINTSDDKNSKAEFDYEIIRL